MGESKVPAATAQLAAMTDPWCPKNCTGHGVAYRSAFANGANPARVSGVGVCLNGVTALEAGGTPGDFGETVGVHIDLVLSDLDPNASAAARESLARIRALCEDFDAKVWDEIATLTRLRLKK